MNTRTVRFRLTAWHAGLLALLLVGIHLHSTRRGDYLEEPAQGAQPAAVKERLR